MTYNFSKPNIVRRVIAGGLLMAVFAAVAPAHADDYDHNNRRWREHQRQERNVHRDHHGRGHWDHGYWDRDRDDDVYVYRPPAVYYAPPPPRGLDFVFRFGD